MTISPKPWSIYEKGDDIFIADSNHRVVVQIGCQLGELQLEDAKHIVEAVNASAGIIKKQTKKT